MSSLYDSSHLRSEDGSFAVVFSQDWATATPSLKAALNQIYASDISMVAGSNVDGLMAKSKIYPPFSVWLVDVFNRPADDHAHALILAWMVKSNATQAKLVDGTLTNVEHGRYLQQYNTYHGNMCRQYVKEAKAVNAVVPVEDDDL